MAGPRPPESQDDFLALIDVARARRCVGCGVPGQLVDLQFAHVHRRRKFTLKQIAKRGVRCRSNYGDVDDRADKFRDLPAKRSLFRNTLEGTYMFCVDCHKQYDAPGNPVRHPEFVVRVDLVVGRVVLDGVLLPYPCMQSVVRNHGTAADARAKRTPRPRGRPRKLPV